MKKDSKILAIIPARAGSKRLKNKNLRDLNGKPLIAWTIEAALKTNVFDTIMVNTDSEEIKRISLSYDIEVPFLRKAELATDEATTIDVILDTIDFYKKKEIFFDIVVLLQPTSPLRSANDIKNAINLFSEKNSMSVISVCPVEHPVQWCNILDDSLSMENFILKENLDKRSQELPQYYRINGALYIWNAIVLVQGDSLYSENSHAYVMSQKNSIDIDSEFDLKFAEFICNYESK